jgi:hypothetical protein
MYPPLVRLLNWCSDNGIHIQSNVRVLHENTGPFLFPITASAHACDFSPTQFRVSGFPNARCQEFLFSQTLELRFIDAPLPALAPPSYALVHATAFHKTATLYSFENSGFPMPKCMGPLVLRIPDPPIPDVLFMH